MPRLSQLSRLSRPLLGPVLAALVASLAACSSRSPADESTADEAGFDRLVYVVRQHTLVEGKRVSITVADGMGQVMDYGRYVPGARIEVRNLGNDDVENLIDGKAYENADVEGLDLSFDAMKVVFAMKLDSNDHYHIYAANLARSGAKNPYGIRQLTFGSQDDLTPVWVAGDRIAFITNQSYTTMGTRADEYNHSRSVTQIATITEIGGDSDRRLCSQNLSHTFNLFRMQSGQIGFSRWEHLENINDSKLFAMNPDCTQMIALSGQHDKPANSLAQITETLDRNVFVGIGTDRENTIQAGALIRVDARSARDDSLHDEERSTYEVLTPGVPRGDEASAIGRYRSPHMLPDGRLLVSWANGYVNDANELSLTPPNFGIYIYDPTTRRNRPVFDDEATWELYAQPVAPHDEPPPLSSVQASADLTRAMTIGSVDIRQTSLGSLHGNTVGGAQFAAGTPIEDALATAVKVRIIEGFSSEGAPNVTMFGLTMAEGAAILGEARVQDDGSWRAEVPPYIPMHLQAVDEFDLSIRNQTTWIQGMPGESRVCGGCHEERTAANHPADQQLTIATALTDRFMRPIEERIELPWAVDALKYPGALGANSSEIQKILNDKCVQCHNPTQNGNPGDAQDYYTVSMTDETTGQTTPYQIARLDLTDTPVTVTYDMREATYPMSYVSIFYPAAMEMERDVQVVGTLPPKWGIPSDARNSALIEKLNVPSEFDPNRYAWELGQPYSDPNVRGGVRKAHPEDVGVALTREERVALIRAFDVGGQYYSRQNTGFQAYGADPLGSAPSQYTP